jgi:hypothetical protein
LLAAHRDAVKNKKVLAVISDSNIMATKTAFSKSTKPKRRVLVPVHEFATENGQSTGKRSVSTMDNNAVECPLSSKVTKDRKRRRPIAVPARRDSLVAPVIESVAHVMGLKAPQVGPVFHAKEKTADPGIRSPKRVKMDRPARFSRITTFVLPASPTKPSANVSRLDPRKSFSKTAIETFRRIPTNIDFDVC